MLDWYMFIMENIGAVVAIVLVLFNLAVWLARRVGQKREQERYGRYPPAVRSGRLNYDEYKKRRDG